MRQALKDRTVTFTFQDGCIVRTVAGAGGKAYAHRCTLGTFEAIAHAIEESPVEGEGRTVAELAKQEQVAFTQADVAVAFLLERGIVDRRHRRNYRLGTGTYLDCMIEWHALAERCRHEPVPANKGV